MKKLSITDVAEMCHEANRVYCRMIGDYSQFPWADAPEWQKASAIDGVKYRIANRNGHPSDSHVNWLRHKLSDGWKYGPVKDPIKKEHPCCVPFNELPPEQQVKDYLFASVVMSVLHNGMMEGS